MRHSLPISVVLALLVALAWQSMDSAIDRARLEQERLRSRLSFLQAFEARRKAFPRLAFFNPFGNREEDEAAGAALAERAVATRTALRSVTGKESDVTETCRLEDETLVGMSRLSYRKAVAFLRTLEAKSDLAETDKERIIDQLLDVLSAARPTTCLALLASPHAPDLVASARSGYISAALAKLATTDPAQALTWARKHSEIQPDLVDEAAWDAVVTGAAARDMASALRLADDLKVEWSPDLFEDLIGMAANAKEMAVLVSHSRKDQLSKEPSRDPFANRGGLSGASAMKLILNSASRLPAEDGIRWLEECGVLSAEPILVGMCFPPDGIVRWEIPRWFDAMAKRTNDGKDPGLALASERWCIQDPSAVLAWTMVQPQGSAREEAVIGAGNGLRNIDPTAASRWVDRLPEGIVRQRAVESIYETWREKDPSAAAEFAKKHGIKVEEK